MKWNATYNFRKLNKIIRQIIDKRRFPVILNEWESLRGVKQTRTKEE